LSVNKKYDANYFLKMFTDRGSSFNLLKRLTEKVGQWHHWLVFALWSTAQCPPNQTTKLKISHWYFDQWLYPIKTSSSVKNILNKRFPTYNLFHSHPFNEMLIVSGKTQCCNDTFTDVWFTSLLAKNI